MFWAGRTLEAALLNLATVTLEIQQEIQWPKSNCIHWIMKAYDQKPMLGTINFTYVVYICKYTLAISCSAIVIIGKVKVEKPQFIRVAFHINQLKYTKYQGISCWLQVPLYS